MKIFTLMAVMLIAANGLYSQINLTDSVAVRISSIEAERGGTGNTLNWSVTCYLDYARFEIQRSTDGTNYATIHTFEADELRCRDPFDYTDIRPEGRTFYRVRVGDVDGRFYSSRIVAVYGQSSGFDITGITPSLVSTTAWLSVSSSSNETGDIIVTSLKGVPVLRRKETWSKGNNSIELSLYSLPPGSYIVTVTNGKGALQSTRFIKF